MNILLVPDKFKGSLTTHGVIDALKAGINKFNPTYNMYDGIVSDGGDGFLNAIREAHNVEQVDIVSENAAGREMMSFYLVDRENNTAYIELANTSGLVQLSSNERNVLKTSTYGTGIQIKHAIATGVKNIYIGLGGSATNDGGIGIASALGYKFLDGSRVELEPVGENLSKINHIDFGNCISLKEIKVYAVNDVKNPLFGKNGAAYVYAKQKGANDEEISFLDKGLEHLAEKVKESLTKDKAHLAGSGAAGGAGYGLKVFLDAEFVDGAEFILKQSGVYHKLESGNIDLVITGEGKIDDQTAQGKLIMGVTKLSTKFEVPTIAICGQKNFAEYNAKTLRLDAIIEVADTSKSLQYNMDNAAYLIENAIFEYLTSKFDSP